MLQRIVNQGTFNERQAAKWMKTILETVEYMHNINIVHRDLKADNILFSSTDEKTSILKLIDFGESEIIDNDQVDDYCIGGKHYMPPETFRRRYGWELKKGKKPFL